MVHVWVDGSGRLTEPPMVAGDAAREAVSLGIFAVLAFTVVLVLSYETFRLVLEERGAGRAAGGRNRPPVGPVWTGKVTED